MKTKSYKLFGSSNATTSAVASLIIQRRCILTGWSIGVLPSSGGAGGNGMRWEVSTNSTVSTGTNDTTNCIAEIAVGGSETTSGVLAATQACMPGIAIPLEEGTRVYLHSAVTGAFGSVCTAVLYVSE